MSGKREVGLTYEQSQREMGKNVCLVKVKKDGRSNQVP